MDNHSLWRSGSSQPSGTSTCRNRCTLQTRTSLWRSPSQWTFCLTGVPMQNRCLARHRLRSHRSCPDWEPNEPRRSSKIRPNQQQTTQRLRQFRQRRKDIFSPTERSGEINRIKLKQSTYENAFIFKIINSLVLDLRLAKLKMFKVFNELFFQTSLNIQAKIILTKQFDSQWSKFLLFKHFHKPTTSIFVINYFHKLIKFIFMCIYFRLLAAPSIVFKCCDYVQIYQTSQYFVYQLT